MKNTFVLQWGHGPAWVEGKTVREQPYWNEHADFMDPIFERGMVVLGGPFADGSGSLLVLEAEDEREVRETFAADPFVTKGIFVMQSLKQWTLFLDARRVGVAMPPSPRV
jgi:uncharacterized protein YciI